MTLDAVVIGAGPAGSVAARERALRGCSVLLVEKARVPRAKVCGCCVNGAAVRTLQRLGLSHVLAGGESRTVDTTDAYTDQLVDRGVILSAPSEPSLINRRTKPKPTATADGDTKGSDK